MATLSADEIIRMRLFNQQLAVSDLRRPEAVVAYMGAMQAQEWSHALWAVGLRAPGIRSADVEAAMNAGSILRTHMLRPTWHFVAVQDIRWMQALTGPRVYAANASYDRKLEIDDHLMGRCKAIFVAALEGGKFLNRNALKAALAKENIMADGHRLAYIVMRAELDCVLCSGPRLGKQFTYALLDERVPATPTSTYEENLARLTALYFSTRGPATLQDYVWWSGLTMKQAKEGVALLPSHFVQADYEGQTHYYAPHDLKLKPHHQTTFLLPDYDEYGISYKNRKVIAGVDHPPSSIFNGLLTYNHWVILEGRSGGKWKGDFQKRQFEAEPFSTLSPAHQKTFDGALERFRAFWG